MTTTKKLGRPKGGKNKPNKTLISVNDLINHLGHDSKVLVPVPTNWYNQVFR
tara:strand:+ start:508 stop:663 length:156 start_codon:yes stop_codon:yes gene_type:complete